MTVSGASKNVVAPASGAAAASARARGNFRVEVIGFMVDSSRRLAGSPRSEGELARLLHCALRGLAARPSRSRSPLGRRPFAPSSPRPAISVDAGNGSIRQVVAGIQRQHRGSGCAISDRTRDASNPRVNGRARGLHHRARHRVARADPMRGVQARRTARSADRQRIPTGSPCTGLLRSPDHAPLSARRHGHCKDALGSSLSGSFLDVCLGWIKDCRALRDGALGR